MFNEKESTKTYYTELSVNQVTGNAVHLLDHNLVSLG